MQDPLAAPPAHLGGAVIQRRLLDFDAEGNPCVVTVPLVTKSQLQDLWAAAGAAPYLVADPLSEEYRLYHGLSCAEVMVRKRMLEAARTGEQVSVDGVMDRLMGRPKQSSETTKLVLSYEDRLAEIARLETAKAPRVIDVTPLPPESA